MNGAPRRLLWLTTVATAVSGLAYAAMRYLLESDDPFSALGHPMQPWALASHVLIAPVMVFAVGWFWGLHVLPKLRRETVARRSGVSLMVLAVVMIASGYGLQVLTAPLARLFLAWTHGLSGALFAGLLAGHQLIGLRATRCIGADAGETAADEHIQVVSRTGRSPLSGCERAPAGRAGRVATVGRRSPLSSLDSEPRSASAADGGVTGEPW